MGSEGQILWSTLLGGPNYDRAYAIEVDGRGFVYIAGRAGRGFPVTQGVFQPGFQGGQEAAFYGPQDGFLCKLTADRGERVFCSYFGTNDVSIIRDLAVDQNGDIYVASGYSSGTYPAGVRERFNNRPHGAREAVLAKIKGDGSVVLWATYLGGSDLEFNQNSVRVDGTGFPYILLTTRSSDIQTTADAFDRTYAGNEDLYVAKLTPDTGQLQWATYLGGTANESTETHEFAVDREGMRTSPRPRSPKIFRRPPARFNGDTAEEATTCSSRNCLRMGRAWRPVRSSAAAPTIDLKASLLTIWQRVSDWHDRVGQFSDHQGRLVEPPWWPARRCRGEARRGLHPSDLLDVPWKPGPGRIRPGRLSGRQWQLLCDWRDTRE